MRLRKVALERRGLDAIDRQDREEERVLTERIAVGAENEALFALDSDAHFLGFGGERVEPALRRREAARAGLGLPRRALRGGALESGFALGCHASGYFRRAGRARRPGVFSSPRIRIRGCPRSSQRER